jgi:hypothetical protein
MLRVGLYQSSVACVSPVLIEIYGFMLLERFRIFVIRPPDGASAFFRVCVWLKAILPAIPHFRIPTTLSCHLLKMRTSPY